MRTLNRKTAGEVLGGVLALLSFGPALAHHSYSMFDLEAQKEISGFVRTLEWANPHAWLWITVVDVKGKTSLYPFEGTSPGEMARRSGWTKTTVMAGDKVTVKYHPFKDGKNGGRIVTVTLPNGRTLNADSGYQPAAASTTPPNSASAAPKS